VRQAAATVLRVNNRTVGVLEPKPADPPAPERAAAAAGGAR